MEAEILSPGLPPRSCRVVDISDSGARLELGSGFGIADVFELSAFGSIYPRAHCPSRPAHALHRVYIVVAIADPCRRWPYDEIQIYLGGLSGAGSGGRGGGGSIGLPGVGSRIGSGIGSGGLSIGGDGSRGRPASLTTLFDNTNMTRMASKRVNSAEVPAHQLVRYEIRKL